MLEFYLIGIIKSRRNKGKKVPHYMAHTEKCRYAINIHGIVQGVGYCPFLYRLATAHDFPFFCHNTPGGVYCEVEGKRGCGLAISFLTASGAVSDISSAVKLLDEFIKNGKIAAVRGLAAVYCR